MKVSELINLLAEEDPNSDVYLVSPRSQSVTYGFAVCSQAQGVSQIPVGRVLLLPMKETEFDHG